MRAILIDPSNKALTEVDYNGDYKTIYTFLESTDFNAVTIHTGPKASDRAIVWVDGEGLLVNPNPLGYFHINGYGGILAGKGLVLGDDGRGETVALPPMFNLQSMRENVQFIDNPPPEMIEPKMHFTSDPDEIAAILGKDHPLAS